MHRAEPPPDAQPRLGEPLVRQQRVPEPPVPADGLREEAGKHIEAERAKASFTSIEDVAYRCGLRDDELATLAEIGAFAAFGRTRREALWQVAGLPMPEAW